MAPLPSEVYIRHHALIERCIATVCRRHGLREVDAEDFAGVARLHLIHDNYAVLRRFEGRSSIASYLAVVITRQFQDWRNARWGKWRSSAEAKRLGETAVRLEMLTVRDGLSLDEAHETLRTHHGVRDSRTDLETLAARFPIRHKRFLIDDGPMEGMAATFGAADASVREREARDTASRAATALAAAVTALPPQDRLILKMRFESGCQISDIARALHLESKPLYRRLDRLLASLRASLEQAGLTAEAASEVLDARGFDAVDLRETRGEVRPFARTGHTPALTGGHHD